MREGCCSFQRIPGWEQRTPAPRPRTMWPYFQRPGSRIICGANPCPQAKNHNPFPKQKKTCVITWDTLSTKTEEKKNTKSEARLLLGAARCTHIDLRYRYGQGSEV